MPRKKTHRRVKGTAPLRGKRAPKTPVPEDVRAALLVRMNDPLPPASIGGGRQARHPLADDAERARLISLIERGNYIDVACGVVGIGKERVYEWCRRGARARKMLDEGTTTVAELTAHEAACAIVSDDITAALALAEADMVKGVAASTAWQARAWLLERRFPGRWQKSERHHVDGPTSQDTAATEKPKASAADRVLAKLAELKQRVPFAGPDGRDPRTEEIPPG